VPGSYSDEPGAESCGACAACPAGSSANLPGSASCTACSPGNYAPEGAADGFALKPRAG